MKSLLEQYQTHELLAKSPDYGALPLIDHLRHVGDVAYKIGESKGFDPTITKTGGLLHDIGKAHPTYQAFVHKFPNRSDQQLDIPHRHELSSLLFLPLFPKKWWLPLTEMIVAHHKSVCYDKRQRGILDLVDNYKERTLLESHAGYWDEWVPRAINILNDLDFNVSFFERKTGEEAFKWVIDYCEDLDYEWSPWRGVLMAGDHMASALTHKQYEFLPNLFEKPRFEGLNPQNDLFPLSIKDYTDERPHTLVVAPTGAGKTDFLLRRCRGRVFYTLPFQASINAMYNRIQEIVPAGTDVRVLHSSSRLVGEQSEEEVQMQPFVGASVKVLTPYQLASLAFGNMGYEAMLLDIQDSDVILDEIHTYDEVSQAIILAIVDVLLGQNCRIHIGTATMPSDLYSRLFEKLGKESHVYPVHLTEKELDTYDRHVVHKIEADEADDFIAQGLNQGEKVLIVCNTVNAAQEKYRSLLEQHPDTSSLLIHSRFKRKDRNEREESLKNQFNTSKEPCFVVSTQVVEVSLDISFDRMITEVAPLDSMLQRFGRINRERVAAEKRTIKPVFVVEPQEKTLPYKKETVQTSFNQLPNNEVLRSKDIQSRLDAVFPEVNIAPIESQVFIKQDEVGLKRLSHNSNPVLMNLLEIDSVACILNEDVDAYENGDWEERKLLEITVPYKSIIGIKNELARLEGVGNEPFIMDNQEEYQTFGLIIQSPQQYL